MKSFKSVVATLGAAIMLASCTQNAPVDSAGSSGSASNNNGIGQNRIMVAANPAVVYEGSFVSHNKSYNALDVMDAAGTNPTHLLSSTTAGYQFPSWSNTGSQISYVASSSALNKLTLAIVNGVPTAQSITTLFSWTAADSIAVFTQAWSTSAGEIAFTKRQTNKSIPSGQRLCRIYIISSSGGTPTLLYSETGTDIRGLSWSPDGTKIAFTSVDSTLVRTIRIISRSTGTVLASYPLSQFTIVWNPEWSRSGSNKIAFRANVSGGANQIYTLDLDQQNPSPVQITTPTGDQPTSPSWSPDNTKIMYYSQSGNTYPVKTVTLANGTITTVSTTGSGLNLKWKQ